MPEPLTRVVSPAAPLLIDNIDTDQIIPSREMRTVSRHGLADGLFAGWRYRAPGARDVNPDFVLNTPPFDTARVLIGGANFGCGSSREHAVWALAEYGFRAIVAPSFGAIFRGNCLRNGVLAMTLDAETVAELADYAASGEPVSISLPDQTLRWGERSVTFDVDASDKRMLVEGLDLISLTQTQAGEIDGFLRRDRIERPWVYSDEGA